MSAFDLLTKPPVNPINNSGVAVRGQSAMWNDCPMTDIRADWNRGYHTEHDFTDGPVLTSRYTNTATGTSGAGTFTIASEEGGVATMDAGAVTTIGRGSQVQQATTVGAFIATATTGRIWFETRVKGTNIVDFLGAIGLATIDTAVLTSNLATFDVTDFIGFKSLLGTGTLTGTSIAATSATSAAAAIGSLSTAYQRIGFKVTNRSKVEFYLDGVLSASTVIATIPTGLMVPTFVTQAFGGGTQPTLSIDWFRCYVEQVSS